METTSCSDAALRAAAPGWRSAAASAGRGCGPGPGAVVLTGGRVAPAGPGGVAVGRPASRAATRRSRSAPTSSTNTSSSRRPPRRSSMAPSAIEPTVVHDGDAVAEALDDLHHVAGEHHRVAVVGEPLEHRRGWPGSTPDRRPRTARRGTAPTARAAGRRPARPSCACRCCSRRPACRPRSRRSSTSSSSLVRSATVGRRHAPQQPAVVEQLGPGQPVEQPELVGQHADAWP